VIAYPDTSFLYAFYLKQSNSPAAAAIADTFREPLQLTDLLRYEFRQSLRFQVRRRAANSREGITIPDAQRALSQLELDLSNGIAVMVSCSSSDLLDRAERLSAKYTIKGGHRSMDILHVATALVLDAKEFLTFNSNQRRLAQNEGIVVPS
jgi:predicted nucleic acid-binding protein